MEASAHAKSADQEEEEDYVQADDNSTHAAEEMNLAAENNDFDDLLVDALFDHPAIHILDREEEDYLYDGIEGIEDGVEDGVEEGVEDGDDVFIVAE